MKIELELFGASKDFSKKDCLLIEVKDKSSIKECNKCGEPSSQDTCKACLKEDELRLNS